jgi:hypothetical protein
MPTEVTVVRALLGPVYRNLVWLYRRFGYRPPEDGFGAEAEALAWMIVGEVCRGCTCSERWLPPERRERDFWLAAERCEAAHQLTAPDLARSGRLHPADTLGRVVADTPAAATVEGAGCTARLAGQGPPAPLVAAVLREALRALFPPSWAYASDERFWRRQAPGGAWQPLDEAQLPRLAPPVLLQGRYLGYGVAASLGEDGRVTFDGASYPSLSAAAAAARAWVKDRLQPARPWFDWACPRPAGPASLEALREETWKAFFQEDYQEEQWDNDTCHHFGDKQAGWGDFWLHAAVGAMLPLAREFGRSVLFHLFSFPDGKLLDCGEVVICSGCRMDSDGSPCRICEANGVRPPLRAELFFQIFPRGERALWPAWRCIACGNYFYAADPRPLSCDVCPGCHAPHSPQTTAVMRPRHTFPSDDPNRLPGWPGDE